MGKIFALEGLKGVGKTTLLKNLKDIYPELEIYEGFKLEGNSYNLNIENEFYKNQKIYIDQKISQYNEILKSSKNAIVTRGSEDILMFCTRYSKINGFNWKIEENLKLELKKLCEYKSDLIIYLDAEDSTIKNRCSYDENKKRTNIENWMELWSEETKKWYLKYKYLKIINTENKTSLEVAKEVKEILQKEVG